MAWLIFLRVFVRFSKKGRRSPLMRFDPWLDAKFRYNAPTLAETAGYGTSSDVSRRGLDR